MKKMYYTKKNFFILFAFAAVSIIFNMVLTAYTDKYVLAQAFVVIFQSGMLLSVVYYYRKSCFRKLICFEFVTIHFINLIKSIVLLSVALLNESRFLVYNVLGYHIIALTSITLLMVATIRFMKNTEDGSSS